MEKMVFSVDRTVVTEGDIVQIDWNCAGCDRAELGIDNGFRLSSQEVPPTGSKRFRLNRSKGRTRLTLTAHYMDKTRVKTLKVKVKPMPVTQAEEVDHRGRRVGAWQSWWQRMAGRMGASRPFGLGERLRQATSALPLHRRLASRLMVAVLVVALLSAVFPRLITFLLLLLAAFLAWVAYRR